MKSIMVTLLLGLFSFLAGAQTKMKEKIINNLQPKEWEDISPDISVSKFQSNKMATELAIKQSFITRIYQNEPEVISVSIPGLQTYIFEKVQNHSEDIKIENSEGKNFEGKEYIGVHYQTKTGVGGISFFKDHLMGVISENGTQYNIGRDPGGERYFLTDERRLPPNPFLCEPIEDEENDFKQKYNSGAERSALLSCKITKIGFQASYSTFKEFGFSEIAVSNYLNGIFNLTKQIYKNERVGIKLSYIEINTVPDVYTYNSASTNLGWFGVNNPVGSAPCDLYQLIDLRTSNFTVGGSAYTDKLCSAAPNSIQNQSYSGTYKTYQNLPVFSWTIQVVVHEFGHNFGSKHTHWCGWDIAPGVKGRIDSCFAGESGYSLPAGFTSTNCNTLKKWTIGGTIMSYCYNNGTVDFNKGFGPLPGNVIRGRVASATCVATEESSLCDSLLEVQPPAQCVSGLLHYMDAKGQSCFTFNIRPGCRYTLNYCRYDGYSQANQPPAGLVPSACGIRNGIFNYLPTAMELAAGKIDLMANGQPFLRQRWYALRCQGSDGITQVHFFWWN